MHNMVITASNCITPIGIDSQMTASSVRAGISRLMESASFDDIEGNFITEARLPQISDELDETKRIEVMSLACLEGLLKKKCNEAEKNELTVHFLLGTSTLTRPGPRYEGPDQEAASKLQELIALRLGKASFQLIPSGNPAVIKALLKAQQILTDDPASCCIVGSADSLLSFSTLCWFEESERLKSNSYGRSQGLIPSEAIGFLLLESEENALKHGAAIQAKILGLGCAMEPAPLVSYVSSQALGLTEACQKAICSSGCNPEKIRTVFADLNGEYFRTKEWHYAEMRCFQNCESRRHLWHPADCMGSIGAASGAVLIALAVEGMQKSWVQPNTLVVCSDDEGECGAVVLAKGRN